MAPLPEHLAELRADGRMLDVPADKATAIVDAAAPYFTLVEHLTVRETISLTDEAAGALVAMGPSAHHAREATEAPNTPPDRATLAVDVLHFRRL
ncbi:hypothetical protein [Leifsonia poae]|uniref:hypothetical protein n=1 Tax=Leifsonia poae TaxID=110933 RepID=UPI003D66E636